MYDYKLYDTGVTGTTKGNVTIESDGYYYVNNQKTKILAPTLNEEKWKQKILMIWVFFVS